MLCPFCLQEVEQFKEARQGGVRGYTCPQCQEAVPIRYVHDYQRYPPVVFTLVGLRGHGKTCYLASLFQALKETAPRMWPRFSYTPVDEESLAVVREKQQALASGKLPDPTPTVFQKPAILQLNQVSTLGDWHLLAYDISGEAFEEGKKLQEYGGYLARSGVVVWLVSLKDVEIDELEAFMVRYVDAMQKLECNPREQSLLMVITKGDELLESLPEEVRHFLANESAGEEEKMFWEISRGLEKWLEVKRGYNIFVRQVRREFKGVYYTIVSSLGARPEGQKLETSVRSRRVLAPVIQLLAFEHQKKKEKEEQKRIQIEVERRRIEELERQRKKAERRKHLRKVILSVSIPLFLLSVIGLFLLLSRPEHLKPDEPWAERLAKGGSFVLAEGRYQLTKPLRLQKSVTLKGAGKERTRILCGGEGYVLEFTGGGSFTAEGISFEHTGNRWADVLRVSGAKVILRSCRFTGGVRDEQNKRGGDGLWLYSQWSLKNLQGVVENCEMVRNGLHGIHLTGQAMVTLDGNICKENKVSGIAYLGNSAGTARNNTCTGNKYGIYLATETKPNLEGNICKENQDSGIAYFGSAGGTASNNTCNSNERNGIYVGQQAQPTLTGNTCRYNKWSGIAYYGNARGTAYANNCSNNESYGIYVGEQAQPTLEGKNHRPIEIAPTASPKIIK